MYLTHGNTTFPLTGYHDSELESTMGMRLMQDAFLLLQPHSV